MQIFVLESSDFPDGRLGESETRHCIKVLRHQVGDEIFCIDGRGTAYSAHILSHTPKATVLQLGQSYPAWGEHSGNIRLAVSPLRLKDRFEFLIEKAVELGVNEIYPVLCKHTDKYQAKFKAERLETQILTATKQCKRSQIPILHPLQAVERFLEQPPLGQQYIGYCEQESVLLQHHAQDIRQAETITLLIGPEGDFTEEEVRLAERQGFQTISLGETRLRAETAAVYAMSVLKMLRGY